MEKLRGHRTTREGIIPNNGCNPPCPNSGHNSGCSSCAAAAPVVHGGCSSCSGSGEVVNYDSGVYQEGTYQDAGSYDSGSVIYDPLPTSSEPIISTPSDILPSASDVLPSASDIVPAATEGSVVVPGAEGASNGAKKPVVDPTAFVIKEG